MNNLIKITGGVLLLVSMGAAQEPAASKGLTATASSFQPGQNNEPQKAVDGNDGTFWHSAWDPYAPLPQTITVDQGAVGPVACLTYLPRQNGENGIITAYNVQVSTDGSAWTPVVSNGKWAATQDRKFANFAVTKARYVRLEAIEGVGKFASAAEITLSPVPVQGPPQVKVLSPAYCSDIKGKTSIQVAAPGFTRLTANCWKQGKGLGADSTVATVALDADGKGTFVFPADDYPHGPITVRISGANGGLKDNCYLQLYNKGGVSWNEGIPKDAPPAAAGLPLIFADDFKGPLSISSTDPKATYYDHKPPSGFQDFSAHVFSGFDSPKNPFLQVDTYLRIRASDKTKSAGLISSMKNDGSGILASIPCYFECRFIGPNAIGSWPGYWLMTDYMTDYAKMKDKTPCDELDIIEAYGGEGPRSPNAYDSYMISPHAWNQGDAGKALENKAFEGMKNPIRMKKFGIPSTWFEAFHTYGCKVTETETFYYCDNIEVGHHATLPICKEKPLFFMVNLATGGGWPIDLSRYDGTVDMYVDFVRVYGTKPPGK